MLKFISSGIPGANLTLKLHMIENRNIIHVYGSKSPPGIPGFTLYFTIFNTTSTRSSQRKLMMISYIKKITIYTTICFMSLISHALTSMRYKFCPRYAIIGQKSFNLIVWIMHIQFKDIGVSRYIRNIN